MEKILSVLEVIVPIFVAIAFGMLARKKQLLTPEENKGLQQFVVKFALPCVVFQACMTAQMGAESLSSMALCLPMVVIGTFWAFWARKKLFPYHNLPQLFAAQETGMLGIPLSIILLGTDQAFRMGILDLTQAVTAYPTIAILSAAADEELPVGEIVKKILRSPLLIMSALGLFLNFSGLGDWMNTYGLRDVLTATTGFLSQPISAVMLFSVGYNFSLAKGSREAVFKIAGIHFAWYVVCILVSQLVLGLIPGVDPRARWTMLLFCLLPPSYLAPGLGRDQKDYTLASGVCSVLTVTCLVGFCVIAAFVV